jgi:nitric oxide reductase NorD protein
MAEAEDVLIDAARHATVFARGLWARHRQVAQPEVLGLADVAERLAVLIQGAFALRVPIRVAQEPARQTWLARVFRRQDQPRHSAAIPATDGTAIWLPRQLPGTAAQALAAYRCMALLQAMRIVRASAQCMRAAHARGLADPYLLIETAAAESRLAALLPGMKGELAAFRAAQLARRPPLDGFPPPRRPLEVLIRNIMRGELPEARITGAAWTPMHSLELVAGLAQEVHGSPRSWQMYRDLWSGELRAPPSGESALASEPAGESASRDPVSSARLARRPEVRAAEEKEDDERPGAWMVQSAQPAESAEDPFGLQRPADLDKDTAADEYADSVSELPAARLVSTPEPAREILLSDDPLEALTRREPAAEARAIELSYPEWDCGLDAYHHPGARVRLLPAPMGSGAWVAQTLHAHRAMCEDIRRRFEMLRAGHQRTRKQLDGDEIDVDAYVEARADMLAGLPMAQAVYQNTRLTRRDMAITLLVDVSGSTDSWISERRRIVDVEREAVLLVCVALESLREPYSVLAFSGEGRNNVTVRELKAFDEAFGDTVARRIAALEPEYYTRAGAALRHATARLVARAARHRLLLVLTDGKPNDNDEYDGRYGAEDMRQSVAEARLQGIYPFCLTIDRQAASYLPRVFGANHYALLHKPELLPVVLLDWVRRLIAA